jgi:hypothetical protein
MSADAKGIGASIGTAAAGIIVEAISRAFGSLSPQQPTKRPNADLGQSMPQSSGGGGGGGGF